MTYQSGKDMLIKVDFEALEAGYDPNNPGNTPQLKTIGGFRSNSFTINGETIDVTNKDSAGFRELISGGFRALSLSGSGVFVSDQEFKDTNTLVLTGTLAPCEIIVPGLGTYAGMFAFKSLQMSGEHNGEISYSLSMESAGVITFT